MKVETQPVLGHCRLQFYKSIVGMAVGFMVVDDGWARDGRRDIGFVLYSYGLALRRSGMSRRVGSRKGDLTWRVAALNSIPAWRLGWISNDIDRSRCL